MLRDVMLNVKRFAEQKFSLEKWHQGKLAKMTSSEVLLYMPYIAIKDQIMTFRVGYKSKLKVKLCLK